MVDPGAASEQTYALAYSYDLAGHLTAETYPSGKVITNVYDGAGRLNGVAGQQGASTKTYASALDYAPHGAVQAMMLGNLLWEHTAFNSRLQPTQIGLGASRMDSGKLQLDYAYGATDNNGNVKSQTITLSGLVLQQSYSYDELNRLKSAQESSGSTQSWQQTFLYDRYGNRRVDAANTTQGLAGPNPVFNPSTNRIAPQGSEPYQYDAAGNLTVDSGGQSYAYDGENKLVTYNGGAANGGASYSYDGDGHRIKKVVGAVTTVFVYDAAGLLVAEYDDSGSQPTGGTSYLTADNLGTPRIITDANGNVIARHDYLPFGEEVSTGVGGRAAQQGYGVGDSIRQKFTGKERDGETGLDYFQARYYANTQGRFTSVDPMSESAEPERPQTWNRYAYVLNNPLNSVDPDGLRYVQRTLADGSIQYGWCATDECYNHAIDSTGKDYQGWTPVTFDESKPFSFLAPGIGGERDSWYVLNPDGTHGYWQVLHYGQAGASTDWNAQFAIGGVFKGLMNVVGGLIDSIAGGATEATTQAATQAATQATTQTATQALSCAPRDSILSSAVSGIMCVGPPLACGTKSTLIVTPLLVGRVPGAREGHSVRPTSAR